MNNKEETLKALIENESIWRNKVKERRQLKMENQEKQPTKEELQEKANITKAKLKAIDDYYKSIINNMISDSFTWIKSNLTPERVEGESREEYINRRKKVTALLRRYLKANGKGDKQYFHNIHRRQY